MAIITLTTDFGTRDGYVGALKGVLMCARDPDTDPTTDAIVDITHDVPRGDVAHAAWIVATTCREFPKGSTHIVIVDPGFGAEFRSLDFRAGARESPRAVVVYANDSLYVGPDNGVFAYLDQRRAHAIEGVAMGSELLHSRDVFATAAAQLSVWNRTMIGAPIALEGRLPWGNRPDGEGRVVHVDHFGNLVSDLPGAEAGAAIAIAGRRLAIARTYADVAPGELLAYVGSARTIEIAVRDGRADRVLDAPRGTRVTPVLAATEFR